MGFGIGVGPILFACVRDVVQPSVRGMASGLINTGIFIGIAITQLVFGYILDLGWEGKMLEGARLYPLEAFQQGFLLCSVLAVLGFLGALLIKETHCREIYSA